MYECSAGEYDLYSALELGTFQPRLLEPFEMYLRNRFSFWIHSSTRELWRLLRAMHRDRTVPKFLYQIWKLIFSVPGSRTVVVS